MKEGEKNVWAMIYSFPRLHVDQMACDFKIRPALKNICRNISATDRLIFPCQSKNWVVLQCSE